MSGEADSDRPLAFISHHSSQAAAARRLKAILARNGIAGWMAPDDIGPGKPFDEAIVEQIELADLVILLFSERSDRSRHVKRELVLADNRGTPVYSVRLEDRPAGGLAYWLNDQQWIDWFDGKDSTIQQAIDRIREQIAETAGTPIDAVSPDDLKGLAGRLRRPTASYRRSIWQRRIGWVAAGAGVGTLAYWGLGLGGPDEAEPLIRAGLWETRVDVVRVLRTDNPDAEAMNLWEIAFEQSVPRHCVDEDEARMPGIAFFDPGRRNNCALSDIEMADGELTVDMECQPNSLEGNNLQLALDGEYTSEGFVADAEYAYDRGTDGEFRFLVRQTGRYLGPCDNTESEAGGQDGREAAGAE